MSERDDQAREDAEREAAWLATFPGQEPVKVEPPEPDGDEAIIDAYVKSTWPGRA